MSLYFRLSILFCFWIIPYGGYTQPLAITESYELLSNTESLIQEMLILFDPIRNENRSSPKTNEQRNTWASTFVHESDRNKAIVQLHALATTTSSLSIDQFFNFLKAQHASLAPIPAAKTYVREEKGHVVLYRHLRMVGSQKITQAWWGFQVVDDQGTQQPKLTGLTLTETLPAGAIEFDERTKKNMLLEGKKQSPVRITTGLQVELMTDKGRSQVVYKEGESMRLSVKTNKACYLRLVYVFEDGTKVLLLENYPVDASTAEQFIEIPASFECVAPFGDECLIAYASTKLFCPVKTRREGEFNLVEDPLTEVTHGCRAIRIKNQFAEAVLPIKTVQK